MFKMTDSLFDALDSAFSQQLLALARTLKLDPQVPENQVLDRVALSFRKLLNYLAQHEEATARVLLAYPARHDIRAQLVAIMQENWQQAQETGIFRKDIPIVLLAELFTAMLLQLAQLPADAATRHQQSLAATRLFCEGVWLGGE